ncbi:3-phosphoshikimate 1-carboxyvinyltransferase [Neptuniibacter sp. 2_MG-2023]|uniref:3-phosphoshikimate 1-carboxyvinyltransferase n=1 Tax=Neptuniibacter sp. 2_MG-2023 TaxID=3062671 RepID=UPI0026E3AC34|nr:3-phosphoshikimate 1-carboxyvinyltransferase [Neptuniibacter sp. 2_MG-2023]MDO6512896.1 3-phosphoshikimate 1-carboxyvinyltransferase [Neptuniibacter sp. 2_MG-2023]
MNRIAEEPKQKDWFENGLMQRLPSDMHDSFTAEQIAALKVAFGARKWGKHPIDLRGTVNLWSWRYYFVFLMGRNQRSLSRKERRVSLIIKTLFMFLFLTFSTLLGLLVLYLAKSAAGIDLLPGFSFGIWGWFKETFL